jgi:hypothetical protein
MSRAAAPDPDRDPLGIHSANRDLLVPFSPWRVPSASRTLAVLLSAHALAKKIRHPRR